jgi:hypothetical protein
VVRIPPSTAAWQLTALKPAAVVSLHHTDIGI